MFRTQLDQTKAQLHQYKETRTHLDQTRIQLDHFTAALLDLPDEPDDNKHRYQFCRWVRTGARDTLLCKFSFPASDWLSADSGNQVGQGEMETGRMVSLEDQGLETRPAHKVKETTTLPP